MKKLPGAIRITSILVFLPLLMSCAGSLKPDIITRDEWGSQPVIADSSEQTIRYITIHHSGVYVSPDEDPRKYLRNLQEWSRKEKHWIDIPYHYLIDLDGRVYEGRPVRYAGDTNTDYDPRGHLLISVIGNYEVQPFSEKQYQSLVRLLAYCCEKYKVDPSLIKGHRDYTETACPGKNIYQYLKDGSLISDVRALLKQTEKK
jgi:hypothetical protein